VRIPKTFVRTTWRADWLVEFSIALAALAFLTREFIFATIGVGTLLVLASLGLLFHRRLLTLRREVHVTERLSRARLHLGGCIDGDLTIRNESRLAAKIAAVTPVVEKGLSLNLSSSFNNLLRPGTTLSSRFEITAFRSGRFQISGFTLTVNDARGLFESEVTYAKADWVEVYPAISAVVPVTPLWLYGGGLQVFRKTPAGTDYAGIRQYASGDEYHRVDWKATARLRTLMVKEFHPEAGAMLHILIDTGKSMHQQSYLGNKLDDALAVAMILTERAARSANKVGIWTYNETEITKAMRPDAPEQQMTSLRSLALTLGAQSATERAGAGFAVPQSASRLEPILPNSQVLARFIRLLRFKPSSSFRNTGIHKALTEATRTGSDTIVLILTDLETSAGALLVAPMTAHKLIIVAQIGAAWRFSSNLEEAYAEYRRNDRLIRRMQRFGLRVFDLRPDRLVEALTEQIAQAIP
jgi:uncharacterized protein (DUF58 family)